MPLPIGTKVMIMDKHARMWNYDTIAGCEGWVQDANVEERDGELILRSYCIRIPNSGEWYIHQDDVVPLASKNKSFVGLLEDVLDE